MNFEEFRSESIAYLNSKFDVLFSYQSMLLELMDFFHDLCKKNGIKYYLGFGSLLGAIRDKGIIPWDLDVDLLTLYSEKEKLINVLTKECIGTKFEFVCMEIDKTYEHYDMRLYMKGIDHRLLHIDIFYLVDAPNEKKKYMKFSKKMIALSNIRFKKLHKNERYSSRLSQALHKSEKIILSLVPIRLVDEIQKRLSNKYVHKQSEVYFRTCLSKKKNLKMMYPKIWFSHEILVEVNGHFYNAPLNYEKMLKCFFGDYMKYPAFEARFKELIGNIQLVDMYEK